MAAMSLVGAACGGGGDDAGSPADTSTTQPAIAADDDLRLNEIQVIGTHNSFRTAPHPDEFALLEAMNPAQAAERTYSHRSITDQLAEQNVRQLELDIFLDAEGGLYSEPALRNQAGLPPLVEEVPEMAEPGIKVLHEQDVDYRSVCPTLVACLTEIEEWSDANPGHVPIAVQIQFKDGPLIFPVEDQAVPEKWDAAAMDTLDEEIRQVFDPDDLIVPDDVRGDHASLEEAVLTDGWPTLGESRGKVLFLMVSTAWYRDSYREGRPNLEGRVLFTSADPGQADAAYVGVDDPVAEADRITELLDLGYLVRTRSDVPAVDAAADDTTRRDAALASGAHFVSTDYPGPDGAREEHGNDFVVQLPDGLAARCNPVTAPATCADEAVEP